MTTSVQAISAQSLATQSASMTKPQKDNASQQGTYSVGAIGSAAVYEPSENAKNHLKAGADVQAQTLGAEAGTAPATKGAEPDSDEEMTMSSDQNVEMEVQSLKAERQTVQTQINQAGDSDPKVALQQQLRQLEAEIQRKDSAGYRQSHAHYWQA